MLSEKKFLTNKRVYSRLFHFYNTLENANQSIKTESREVGFQGIE